MESQLEADKLKRAQVEKSKAKLPKLEISKFDGAFVDWLRFWQQFVEEIDNCGNYAAVTKFSYLREFLSDQPKVEITGLPFKEKHFRSQNRYTRKICCISCASEQHFSSNCDKN